MRESCTLPLLEEGSKTTVNMATCQEIERQARASWCVPIPLLPSDPGLASTGLFVEVLYQPVERHFVVSGNWTPPGQNESVPLPDLTPEPALASVFQQLIGGVVPLRAPVPT